MYESEAYDLGTLYLSENYFKFGVYFTQENSPTPINIPESVGRVIMEQDISSDPSV